MNLTKSVLKNEIWGRGKQGNKDFRKNRSSRR